MENQSILNETLPFFQSVFSSIINQYLIAAVIIFLGFIIGTLVSKFIYKVLHDFELNKFLKSVSGVNIKIEEIISNVIKIFIYAIFIVYVLNYLNLSQLIINVILIIFAIIIGISIILSLRDFIPNFIAGVRISRKELIKEGDEIELDDVKGTVKKVDLTNIEIITPENDIIFYPNSKIIKERFKIHRKEN
ncbi:MAG: small conductance mechanosensitive channel [Candidatus Woesearchaeota archaeon]|nr:small conductance mechanosensitive channel [Candidatus Woesearchaeota archaeon]